MGERLKQYYDEATEIGGLLARVRLAVLTQVTAVEAEKASDTSPLIARFHQAMVQIGSEFRDGGVNSSLAFKPVQELIPSRFHARSDEASHGEEIAPSESTPLTSKESAPSSSMTLLQPPSEARPISDGPAAQMLRGQVRASLELLSEREQLLGSPVLAMRRVTEVVADTLNAERAVVWVFDSSKEVLLCQDQFERDSRQHQAGKVWDVREHPAFAHAPMTTRAITIKDTSAASLCAPIFARGELIGVLLCERVGTMPDWDADDERFITLMANFVALSFERQRSLAHAMA